MASRKNWTAIADLAKNIRRLGVDEETDKKLAGAEKAAEHGLRVHASHLPTVVDLLEDEVAKLRAENERLRTVLGETDTFTRKAQTRLPDGTIVEREWTAAERFHLYARGFRDGAGTRAIRADHEGLGPYARGYADGRAAMQAACAAEAARVGYTPTVLRAAEGSDG